MDFKAEQIILEWQQNVKLRLGVLAIVGIVLFYGYQVLADFSMAQQDDYLKQSKRLRQLQILEHQNGWTDFAQQALQTRKQMESLLWQADSKGLAQAQVQTWLLNELRTMQLDYLQIATGAAEKLPDSPDIWRVTSEITGVIPKEKLLPLIALIELDQRLTDIAQLRFAYDNGPFQLTLSVQSYFKLNGSPS